MAMALPTVPGYSTHLGTRNGLRLVSLLDSLTLCNVLCQWDGDMGTRTVHRADPVLVPGTIYRRRTVSSGSRYKHTVLYSTGTPVQYCSATGYPGTVQ